MVGIGLTGPVPPEERDRRRQLVESLEKAQEELSGVAKLCVFANYPVSERLRVIRRDDVVQAMEGVAPEPDGGRTCPNEDEREDILDIVIRGTVPDYALYVALAKAKGMSVGDCFTAAVMKGGDCWFVLYPADNLDGHDLQVKSRQAIALARWTQDTFDVSQPSVAVMAGGPKEYRENAVVDGTWGDAEVLTRMLSDAGIQAEICAHRLEKAVSHHIVVPVNGFVGNQVFRALHFLAGWELVGAPRLYARNGLAELVCCDCSAYESSFYHHVLFAVACARRRRKT